MRADHYQQAKLLLQPWRAALYDLDGDNALKQLEKIAAEARFRMCAPFGDFSGAQDFYAAVYTPLIQALPDIERRDYIVLAGVDEHGAQWVGCGGFYMGTFLAPWLDIPPSGRLVHMRFHEFYRIKAGKVVEWQALWDIPELMLQAQAWPLAPSLGREWSIPSPAPQDGLAINGTEAEALATRQHIIDMLNCMKKHPRQGAEAMEMERFWHEKMTWYGPAGIGTGRGIAGFRHWHQIPFLRAMPDRGQYIDEITYHFFAQGQYAAVTGWPNMMQTLSHDGWLGIAPSGKRITMRSLDFWRLEQGKIRENWVLVDLIDMYSQLDLDVFARLREFNKARNLGAIDWQRDY